MIPILREAAEWLVVAKPAPLLVHPSKPGQGPTLLGLLREQFLREGREVGELHLVNRLDRETSGCVLLAKSSGAARVLGKAVMRREVEKEYVALVWGWPRWQEVLFEGALRRKGEVEESAVWVRRMVHEGGQASSSRFVRRARGRLGQRKCAVVSAWPLTGRTHQLRVHLEALGHPVVGDKIYATDGAAYLEFLERGWSPSLERQLVLGRQALHGSGLRFQWEGEEVEVRCPWPAEMRDFWLRAAGEGGPV